MAMGQVRLGAVLLPSRATKIGKEKAGLIKSPPLTMNPGSRTKLRLRAGVQLKRRPVKRIVEHAAMEQ